MAIAAVQLAQFVASIAAGVVALDAYNDYRDAVTDSADKSLARAQAHFRLDTRVKEELPAAYEWLSNLPEYEECEALYTRANVSHIRDNVALARQAAMAVGSRGQVGLRRRLARQATTSIVQRSAVSLASLVDLQTSLDSVYRDMRDNAIIGLGGTSAYDTSAITARNNTVLSQLARSSAADFNGALATLGSTVQDIFSSPTQVVDPLAYTAPSPPDVVNSNFNPY